MNAKSSQHSVGFLLNDAMQAYMSSDKKIHTIPIGHCISAMSTSEQLNVRIIETSSFVESCGPETMIRL